MENLIENGKWKMENLIENGKCKMTL